MPTAAALVPEAFGARMTPEEVLAAAEKVRLIVAREEAPPFDLTEFLRVLKEGDCHGFRPPERPQDPMGPQPPRTTLCPNFPNPCYCTGATGSGHRPVASPSTARCTVVQYTDEERRRAVACWTA